MLILAVLGCSITACNSCNNAAEIGTGDKDTIAVTDSGISLPPDSVNTLLVDTGQKVVPRVQAKSAALGYSYFKRIKRGASRDINAFISVTFPHSKIRDTLKKLSQQVMPTRHAASDTSIVFTQNFMVYEYVEISLEDPNGQFTVNPMHEKNRQRIDTLKGNQWRWLVTPTTNQPTALLMLKVVAEKADGEREPLEQRVIPIKVDVELNFIRKVWIWLLDNPEKLLTLILIPVVIWLAKRWVERRKSNKQASP